MNKKQERPLSKWHKYLTKEIGIEFKACLYFYVILFFYSIYRIIGGTWDASIVHMSGMILTTYAMGYLQVYVFSNFDEAEHLGKKEIGYSIVCSVLYTAVSVLCKWFERDARVTCYYFLYMVFAYICAFWVYKIKRDIDTRKLNEDLKAFKERGKEHESCD